MINSPKNISLPSHDGEGLGVRLMYKHIPNTITSLNLISGCIATVFAVTGSPVTALLFIILGAVFDFFDGMTARMLGVSSPIGKELDSLADCVTFGFAPSAMIYHLLCVLDYPSALECSREYLPYIAFVMAAFSALRLAKFNLDERQTSSFIGLPTPANALFWGSLIVGGKDAIASTEWSPIIIILLMFVMSWLLIAEIPMFSLKFKHWNWSENKLRWSFIISCIPLLLLFRISAFAIIIAWYVVLSILAPKQPLKN